MKIGRNEPCPCGSGKKFKKCCINKDLNFSEVTKEEAPEFDEGFFNNHNTLDILQTIAALSVVPENHGKYVRFEILSHETILRNNAKEELVSIERLKDFFDRNFLEHHFEDFPTNLFTDLITFYGGDYLIFPGITEAGNYILSNLLTAVFADPCRNIPDQAKSNFQHVALLLLNISNKIATRIGYSRYEDGKSVQEEIYVPDESWLQILKEAVIFSHEEMKKLLADNDIAPEALEEFLIDITSKEFRHPDLQNSSLLYQPIIKTDDKYIIVSPFNLSFALTQYMWKSAANMGCINEVNDAYQFVLWNMAQLQLGRMGYDRIDTTDLLPKTSLPLLEGLYKFDDDKVAYVQMVYDAGDNYNGLQSFNIRGAAKGIKDIEHHTESVIGKIRATTEYKDFHIQHILLTSPIGRDYSFPVKTYGVRTLCIPMFEFDVLCNLKETTALDLWKFSDAREKFMRKSRMPQINFSFLDKYKVYKDHNDSFYLSDSKNITLMHVQPGYAHEMIRDSKLGPDKHSILIGSGSRFRLNPVERKDRFAPVYINVHDIASRELQFAVEGFNQAFWIKPKNIPDQISPELKSIFWELTDALAYWVWQIQDDLRDPLGQLAGKTITLTFELRPLEKFDNVDRNYERKENLFDKFESSVDGDTVNVVIPADLIPYLYGADNEGEQNLVHHILLGLNKLLSSQGKKELTRDEVTRILSKNVPPGMKKKFFIIDSADNTLIDPSHLSEHRYVQEYDVQIVLDSIVPGLGANCPAVGDVISKEERLKLTRDIVVRVLLPKLQQVISQYDAKQLLERLIGLNESLIRHKEQSKIMIPTRIACYVTVEEQVKDLKESWSNINRTIVATRCLIEHVAAEQVKGKKIISTTAIDELIALMDQIIAWGAIGDQINYDLSDTPLSVLPTGRIGIDKQAIEGILDSYHQAKTSEDVTDAVKSYEGVFAQRNPKIGKELPEYLDKAFVSDFGVSFTRICDFLDRAAYIGSLQNKPFATLKKSELKAKMNELKGELFGDEEFENCIKCLTLFKRGKVEKVPNGFDTFDISPWRFSRRLSFFRRPFVALTNSADATDPHLYWGYRHLVASRIYYVDQLIYGRLKVDPNGAIIKAMGKLVQSRGDSLVSTVSEKLKGDGRIVDAEVPINSSTQLLADKDLGDIDVLVIDTENKVVFNLECKSMAPSRNIKEMVEEVAKLFGSDSDKGWLEKHIARNAWLKDNLELLGKKYGIDLTGYRVKSFFITREDMLTPHLKRQNLPLPFVSKYDIDKNGLNALL